MTGIVSPQSYKGMSLDQYNEALYQNVVNTTRNPIFNGIGINAPIIPYGTGINSGYGQYNEGVYGVVTCLSDSLENDDERTSWNLIKDMSPVEIADLEVSYLQATGKSLRQDVREHHTSRAGHAAIIGGCAATGAVIGSFAIPVPVVGTVIGGAIGLGVGLISSIIAGPSSDKMINKLDEGAKAGSGLHTAMALKDALDEDDEDRSYRILSEVPAESRPELEAYYTQVSGGKTVRQDIREHHSYFGLIHASSDSMISLLNEGQQLQYARMRQY